MTGRWVHIGYRNGKPLLRYITNPPSAGLILNGQKRIELEKK